MAAYRQVYDSHHLQADCQEPGSAPEPYARYRVWATFTFFKSRQNVLSGVVFVSAEIGTETDFVIGNCHDTYRTKFPSTRSVARVQVSALFSLATLRYFSKIVSMYALCPVYKGYGHY